jgi:hypothetical protein
MKELKNPNIETGRKLNGISLLYTAAILLILSVAVPAILVLLIKWLSSWE